MSKQLTTTYAMLLATLACILWSGNFIVARTAGAVVPPVSLNFFRWASASLIILPIGIQKFKAERKAVMSGWKNIFWAALAGVCLFNTLVYVAGHHTTAINLALIGTTSSPIFSFLLARVFLKEPIPPLRLAGLLVCIAGVLLLLSKGSWDILIHLRFTAGDYWILGAAFCFATYNILTRRKAAGISPTTYLLCTFWAGSLLLLPFYIWEMSSSAPIAWNGKLLLTILYLGAGTSVAAFFCWNAAISRLGAARTAIFGNLIPIFSSIEAVWLLHEKITGIHLASMVIVIIGVVLANMRVNRLNGRN